MSTSKQPLPKGMGYPLKPTQLEAVLRQSAVDLRWTLDRNASGSLFECFFWPPNPNVHHERLYFRSSAVPSERVSEAKQYIESTVMPELQRWLGHILSLPADSTVRRERQLFTRELP
jgi:hypothetical protein